MRRWLAALCLLGIVAIPAFAQIDKGSIEAVALDRYREEGTPLVETRDGWRIDLRRARWSPAGR